MQGGHRRASLAGSRCATIRPWIDRAPSRNVDPPARRVARTGQAHRAARARHRRVRLSRRSSSTTDWRASTPGARTRRARRSWASPCATLSASEAWRLPPERACHDRRRRARQRRRRGHRGRAHGRHRHRRGRDPACLRRGQAGRHGQQGAARPPGPRARGRRHARPGVALRFEAAVAAGVPVLGPLVWDLGANRVDRAARHRQRHHEPHPLDDGRRTLGTTPTCSHEAKARGYAEADPASDVEGLDAAYKLTLLARLAFGTWLDVDALRRSVPTIGRRCAPRDHRRQPRPI